MPLQTTHQFLTYSGITNNRLLVGDLVHRISRYSINDILPNAALINNACALAGNERLTGAAQAALASTLFSGAPHFHRRLEESGWSGSDDDPVLFHRQQQLLLMRLAFLSCPAQGAQAWDKAALQAFGEAALIASDLLAGQDYLLDEEERRNRVEQAGQNWRQQMASLMPVGELYIDQDPQTNLGRAGALWRDILFDADLRASEKDLPDLPACFEARYGITVEDLLLTGAGVFAMCAAFDPSKSNCFEQLVINTRTFLTHSSFPPDKLARVLSVLGARIDEMSQSLLCQPTQSAISDFSPFRRHPIVTMDDQRFICLDRAFLMKFLVDGVYWLLHDALPNATQQGLFRSYFGRMYALYLNRLFEGVYGGYTSRLLARSYNAEVRFEDGTELCDGLIDETGDTLVLMEYKGALLTTRVKYSGNKAALIGELDAKFVKGEGRHKKGAAQLAHSIKKLTEGFNIRLPGLRDVTRIRKIYPVLVSYEPSLVGPLVPRYVGEAFQSQLPFPLPDGFPQVAPLTVLTSQDVEAYCSLKGRKPLAQIIEGYLAAGGNGDHPNFRLNDYLVSRREERDMPPTYFGQAYIKLFQATGQAFFPDRSPLAPPDAPG
jgi:hypothetical protein